MRSRFTLKRILSHARRVGVGRGVARQLFDMVEPYLGYILEGKKTIESRFSKPLIPPYRRVALGDVVLLKAGAIAASFR
jgi:hypothetical protein